MHRLVSWLVICLIPAYSLPAVASCGAVECFLVSGLDPVLPEAGRLRLDLSYRFLEQSRLRGGSDDVDEVVVPEINFDEHAIELDAHREVRTQSATWLLGMEYGISDRLAVSARLPLLISREHEHFERVDSHATEVDHQTSSVRTVPTHIVESFSDESYSGIGDAQLGIRYGVVMRPRDLLVGGIRLELPTGAHELSNHHGEVGDAGLMPGTGATGVLFSAYYGHQLEAMRTGLFSALSLRVRTENDLDYRFGDEWVWSVGASRLIGGPWSASMQLNLRRSGRDEFAGTTVPSTGSTFINVTPGARYTTASGFSFYGDLQLPVYQHVNELQLAPGPALVVGVNQTF